MCVCVCVSGGGTHTGDKEVMRGLHTVSKPRNTVHGASGWGGLKGRSRSLGLMAATNTRWEPQGPVHQSRRVALASNEGATKQGGRVLAHLAMMCATTHA